MPDGSATPLASSRMYSGCSGRSITCVTAATRSSRMLQQTQPLARLMHVALDADDELGIDVDRAEVVHQHGDPEAVIAGQDAVQQRRLAGAEEAGQDGQRDGLVPDRSRSSDAFAARTWSSVAARCPRPRRHCLALELLARRASP